MEPDIDLSKSPRQLFTEIYTAEQPVQSVERNHMLMRSLPLIGVLLLAAGCTTARIDSVHSLQVELWSTAEEAGRGIFYEDGKILVYALERKWISAPPLQCEMELSAEEQAMLEKAALSVRWHDLDDEYLNSRIADGYYYVFTIYSPRAGLFPSKEILTQERLVHELLPLAEAFDSLLPDACKFRYREAITGSGAGPVFPAEEAPLGVVFPEE
ncbi:MAG: hypothetical protein ACOCX4_08735 [Planctomycetota bacterium]